MNTRLTTLGLVGHPILTKDLLCATLKFLTAVVMLMIHLKTRRMESGSTPTGRLVAIYVTYIYSSAVIKEL